MVVLVAESAPWILGTVNNLKHLVEQGVVLGMEISSRHLVLLKQWRTEAQWR